MAKAKAEDLRSLCNEIEPAPVVGNEPSFSPFHPLSREKILSLSGLVGSTMRSNNYYQYKYERSYRELRQVSIKPDFFKGLATSITYPGRWENVPLYILSDSFSQLDIPHISVEKRKYPDVAVTLPFGDFTERTITIGFNKFGGLSEFREDEPERVSYHDNKEFFIDPDGNISQYTGIRGDMPTFSVVFLDIYLQGSFPALTFRFTDQHLPSSQ